MLDNQKKLVGIITHSDFGLHKHHVPLAGEQPSLFGALIDLQSSEQVGHEARGRRVKEIMSSPVVTVAEEAPVSTVTEIMVDRRVGWLPLMRGDQLAGIITRHDMLNLTATDESGGVSV